MIRGFLNRPALFCPFDRLICKIRKYRTKASLFQAVAREGNLTRASKQLHLTPQTVSTQIRDLEAALGERLFQRIGRRMFLTEAGQVALRYANEIFSLGQEFQETLRGRPVTLLGSWWARPTSYRS
jgi:molybdenum-dependent DNA-binding transcriptional regulator ModE